MAKKNMDMEVEKEGGGLGKFLFIATPILFTLVLVGAIIMLFNVDLRQSMFSTLDKIPIVKNWVPSADTTNSATANQADSDAATVAKLKQELADSQKAQTAQAAELKKLQDAAAQQQAAQEAQQANANANGAAAGTKVETEQDKQLKNLANVYSDMSASKAAAIMQNMTTDEQVLIFSKMNSQDQASILQKMDPKVAADTSLALKNATAASLAQLQSKTKTTPAAPSAGSNLDATAMAQTFTSMPASSAASLLLQTAKVSQAKVLQVLNQVDDSTRAGILSAMSTEDPAATAQIVNRLMAAN